MGGIDLRTVPALCALVGQVLASGCGTPGAKVHVQEPFDAALPPPAPTPVSLAQVDGPPTREVLVAQLSGDLRAMEAAISDCVAAADKLGITAPGAVGAGAAGLVSSAGRLRDASRALDERSRMLRALSTTDGP